MYDAPPQMMQPMENEIVQQQPNIPPAVQPQHVSQRANKGQAPDQYAPAPKKKKK